MLSGVLSKVDGPRFIILLMLEDTLLVMVMMMMVVVVMVMVITIVKSRGRTQHGMLAKRRKVHLMLKTFWKGTRPIGC